ncbi:hypothetical protein BDN72DRAFT_906049 [Pluteus cervinus]|uniref:Uncharacterized protein n=1 Tax=Pluteus cervinus TaxID=181527 RepID=A0ACD3A0K5_9AGAR|nr:hypothetical protein BDN72DRAFT_906049 [Pluteus cervinus]
MAYSDTYSRLRGEGNQRPPDRPRGHPREHQTSYREPYGGMTGSRSRHDVHPYSTLSRPPRHHVTNEERGSDQEGPGTTLTQRIVRTGLDKGQANVYIEKPALIIVKHLVNKVEKLERRVDELSAAQAQAENGNTPKVRDGTNHLRFVIPIQTESTRERDTRPAEECEGNPETEPLKTGRIHEFIGIRVINGRVERDNSVGGMLGPHVYYDEVNNTIYAGLTAVKWAEYDLKGRKGSAPYMGHNPLYTLSPHGFPTTPFEVDKLCEFIKREDGSPLAYKWEAHMILTEFERITNALNPEFWDNAMQWIAQLPSIPKPRSTLPPEATHPLLPINEELFLQKRVDGRVSLSFGLKSPRDTPGDLPLIAQYAAHNLRIGSPTETRGIIMDWAYRVHLRSIFGYELGRLLGPEDKEARQPFVKALVGVLSCPRAYEEHLTSKGINLQPITLDDCDIQPFEHTAEQMANVTVDDVVDHLVHNNIPSAWIDHAYPYGAQVLRAKAATGSMDADYREFASKQRTYLLLHGIPPAIPDTAEWWTPTREDLARIRWSIAKDEAKKKWSGLGAEGWFTVGINPLIHDQLFIEDEQQRRKLAESSTVTKPASTLTAAGDDSVMAPPAAV